MATCTYAPFIKWVDEWYAGLTPFEWKRELRDPACVALCAENLVNGFTDEGGFASSRLQALVEPVTHLFQRAHGLGVRNFILLQDAHGDKAQEFKHLPRHCVRGTAEAQTVEPLRKLAFANEFYMVRKNSFHPALNTDLDRWLEMHQDLDTFILAGGCTDLCIYQLATYLKLQANARDLPRRVIVAANLVDTYDQPVGKNGETPHDGNLLQRIFLYHMTISGIDVVKGIE
jgi:nicotinamidase-related amidase